MSLQLQVSFFKDDQEVYQTRTPGGFVAVTSSDKEMIADVLETVAWLESKGRSIPEWDRFWIDVQGRIVEYKA